MLDLEAELSGEDESADEFEGGGDEELAQFIDDSVPMESWRPGRVDVGSPLSSPTTVSVVQNTDDSMDLSDEEDEDEEEIVVDETSQSADNSIVLAHQSARAVARSRFAPLPAAPAEAPRPLTERQRVIHHETRIESPVCEPEPIKPPRRIHQLMVVNIPCTLYCDPPSELVGLRQRDPISREFLRLMYLMSSVVRMTGFSSSSSSNRGSNSNSSSNNDNQAAAPAGAASSEQAGVRITAQAGRLSITRPATSTPIYRMTGADGTLKIYPYFEMLGRQPSEDGEEDDRVRFGGVRLYLFLMDDTLDLGKLMMRCLRDAQTPTYVNRMSTEERALLHRNKNELLQSSYLRYIDVSQLNRTGGCTLNEQVQHLERNDYVNMFFIDQLEDIYHPTKFFSLERAMFMHTAEVSRDQCELHSYLTEDGKFKGFPSPNYVSYVPAEVFGDWSQLRRVPMLNAYLNQLVSHQIQSNQDFRLRAMAADELGMMNGMDDLCQCILQDRQGSELPTRQAEHLAYVREQFERANRVARTANNKSSEMQRLGVAAETWRIFERHPLLQLKLHMAGLRRFQQDNFPYGHRHYRAFELMRQREGLKLYEKMMRREKLPGAAEHACPWYFNLPASKQLFNLDHNYVDLSSYGHVKRWIYRVADADLKIHVSHQHFYLLLLSLCMCGRISLEKGRGMAMHIQLSGNAGSGKSWLLAVLQLCAPPGVVQMISHSSALAFTVDDDSMSCKMTMYHEAPPWACGNTDTKGRTIGGYDSTEKRNHTMTTCLSEGVLSTVRLNTDKDKEKDDPPQKRSITLMNGPFVIATNEPVTDGPVGDRMMMCQVSSRERDDASISAMDQDGLDVLKEEIVQSEDLHRIRVLVMHCFMLVWAQCAWVVAEPNFTAYRIFAGQLDVSLGKHVGGNAEKRKRAHARLMLGCWAAMNMTALYRTLYSDQAKYRWREDKETEAFRAFDFSSLMYAARHAVVTSEMVADVFSAMRDDFLSTAGYSIARIVTAKFNPNTGRGQVCQFVYTLDGELETNYVGMEWKVRDGVRVIADLMPPDCKIGRINIKNEIERMINITIRSRPYVVTAGPDGNNVLQLDTTAEERLWPLCRIQRYKSKADANGHKTYLMFHVSLLSDGDDSDDSNLVVRIVRTMLQYDHTPRTGVMSRVVLSLPQIKRGQFVRSQSNNEIVTRNSVMPQLFQTLQLKPDPSVRLRLNNTSNYQQSDMAFIGPVRDHLARCSNYHPNDALDQLRKHRVFSVTTNVDTWAVYEQTIKCGVDLDKPDGDLFQWNYENVEENFCALNHKYREAHRDLFPRDRETTMANCVQEVSGRILKLNNINEAGETLTEPITSITSVMLTALRSGSRLDAPASQATIQDGSQVTPATRDELERLDRIIEEARAVIRMPTHSLLEQQEDEEENTPSRRASSSRTSSERARARIARRPSFPSRPGGAIRGGYNGRNRFQPINRGSR